MPQVRFAPGALRDLQRLREFLRPKNPAAARRAGEAIRSSIRLLGQQPHIGRPVEDMPIEYREWLSAFRRMASRVLATIRRIPLLRGSSAVRAWGMPVIRSGR